MDLRIWITVAAALACTLPAAASAQGNGPGGERAPWFVASSVYQAEGPVYALAGGEFDLAHNGLEAACLTFDGSVVQLSPNFLAWDVAVRYQGEIPVERMSTRPTIDIGDVHSGYPGGEVVVFNRHPSVMRVVFHDPNAGWSQEILDDKTGWLGSGWGARAGDYDPYRPGDEILYIYETVYDLSIATLFREVGGVWNEEVAYGYPTAGEVGMDSAVGDFNWDHSGPEIVISTEMGPTYEIVAPADADASEWPRRIIWDDAENAGWVAKVADVDWQSPGAEIVYGTRYNNRIMLSHHTSDGVHQLETLFTGEATEHPFNMWDIAVGDVLVQSTGLEILGVDQTGSVYLVRRVGEAWEGQVIWRDADPLYAVIAQDLLPQRSGDEILVAGESGTVTLLVPGPM